MYVRHFIKMLLLLILMAFLGIGGLVLADHYSKTQGPSTTANTVGQ